MGGQQMTRADILIKYSRRTLADMVIELEHKVTDLEEQSFDYATRAMRAESALIQKDKKVSDIPNLK